MTAILLRTIFMYVFVFALLRVMGKREIGKLSVFDLVISIMIAEIAVIIIDDTDKPIMEAVGPIVLLVAIQIAIALLTMKNRKLRLWIEGTPSVLIRAGQLNQTEMKKQRYNLDDLMSQLREHKVTNVDDVELAVLESNGKLSVIPKEKPSQQESGHQPANAGASAAELQDSVSRIRYEPLPLPLIVDGHVQDDSLEKLGRNRFWLLNQLREQGIEHFRQVFFCSVDHNGKLYINRK